MAPKKSPAGKQQQTLAAAFSKQKKKKEEAEKQSEGRWQVLETVLSPKLLEEVFVSTALVDCEHYKQGAVQGADAQGGYASTNAAGQRRSVRTRGKKDTLESASSLEDEALLKDRRWEQKGAAFLEVLALHVNQSTMLPLKYQELLLHMVLNADRHTAEVNVSAAAFELLLSNARLHPATQQDQQHPHILGLNKAAWLPHDSFLNTSWYDAVCRSRQHSKLSFLLALLGGAQQCVQQQLGLPVEEAGAAGGAGPLGLSLAFQYVTHLLVQDFEARMKVFVEFGPKMPGTKQGQRGDLSATKLLSNSALAQLLSAFGNNLTLGWPGQLTEVIQRLVGLILETAPRAAAAAAGEAGGGGGGGSGGPLKQQKQATSRSRDAGGPSGAAASAPCSPLAAAASPGAAGACARQLLRCTYDLFLVMEEQRHMFSTDKDTDCRMLALMLANVLSKKKGAQSRPQHVPGYLQDPQGKAALLSALSPRACLHLLGVTYALDAAKRWETSRGETTVPAELQWLQSYKDYAEGTTTARRIKDDGPVQMQPLAFLADLTVPAHLTQSRQGLISHSPGDGFLTWLTSFTSAAALAAQQGHLDQKHVQGLSEAFEKVVARVQQPLDHGASSSQPSGLCLRDRLALARTRHLLQRCGLAPAP